MITSFVLKRCQAGASAGVSLGGPVAGGDAGEQRSFAFGSGKGGYSSQGASPTGFDRNAGYGAGKTGKGRRKKTSGSGVFIGEGPTPGPGAGGGRKRKAKGANGTAAFVRKKKK
ncbi:hypothetical protein XI25_30450 [Paenibacillus sp. DMB20]|nr:hypothetical protein XI25_30450 [Paenibacillus sp. DMB20]